MGFGAASAVLTRQWTQVQLLNNFYHEASQMLRRQPVLD